MNVQYEWQDSYQQALLETDWSKIEEHIQAAESAISERPHELSLNQGETPEENEAIANAAVALEALRNDVAAWKLKQG